MSEHLPILPILVPFFLAVIMLLPPLSTRLNAQRITSVLGLGVGVVISVLLLLEADKSTTYYLLGDWQPPYGIMLNVDTFSAVFVLLTSILGLFAMLSAFPEHDRGGRYFHSLFLFQITGIQGAFLTGDLFNLFVFFEVLLIASYALVIHGGGKHKTKAGFQYVTLNLIGSTFFLFALGLIYGSLGTLNMPDLALKGPELSPDQAELATAGVVMLLLVFGLKAALVPLHFWLPNTYAAAVAPVAALFAVMTKVGIYAFFRVHIQVFGGGEGELGETVITWLWSLAVITTVVGLIGVLAAKRLTDLASFLLIISIGTLLFSIAMNSPEATAAGLYYLVHSTFVTAALYLLADMVNTHRGQAGDRFVKARPMLQNTTLSTIFLFVALIFAGLPPLSGFIGKLAVLQAAKDGSEQIWIWPAILLASLGALVALTRAGTTLFWRVRQGKTQETSASRWQIGAAVGLLACSPLMVIYAGPLSDYFAKAAEQLHQLPPIVQTGSGEFINAVKSMPEVPNG